MSANRSSAVMQQRHVAADSLDYFPTPPFATRALCEFLGKQLGDLGRLTAWEPACGEGHMARPLLELFGGVRLSDVQPYPLVGGLGDHELIDFALTGRSEPPVDVVISNPPFKLAQDFIETGLQVADKAVAMLVRSAFLEGQDRYDQLWRRIPPTFVLQFTERVVMLQDRLVKAGTLDPFAEKEGTKASSATAYVWLVWLKHPPIADLAAVAGHPQFDTTDTRFRWLAPCRQRLEKLGDYPAYDVPQLPPPADGLFGQDIAA